MFVLGDLINGQSLTSLAESTRTVFQNVAAQVQTTFFKQHARDGSHKDVTATSLLIAGLLKTNGRLNIGTPLHINRPLEAATKPFYPGAASRQSIFLNTYGRDATTATFLRVTTSSLDPDPLVWHGLDATGREEGDVVVFLNDGNTVIEFVSESGSTPLNTQFFGATAVSGNYELQSAAIGVAVYSTNQFLGAKFWHWLWF